jgi:hypothetical protein
VSKIYFLENYFSQSQNTCLLNDFLCDWVTKVRELAENDGRLKIADMTIGQVLAQYPEKDKNWPPDEICDLIERVNTKSIKNNFSAAVFNKRSFSSRGPFDEGEIERDHEKYFRELAGTQRNKFPIVATILEEIAKSYEMDAKRQDDSAKIEELDY